ncbi:hypothetical protein C1H46_039689 [Malus baccata]|uniref:Pentacotripeptide-repeat region of PRORP domain-containing protein n=2 Tax=Malus baccata TaxID=106549 RepID=A0A540KKV0_MALBA|nr:hypothetical protein C1H46_039689 [Malus baccata]
MLKTNTPPDTYTFPNLLKACTSLNLSLYGLSFHQCIVVNGFSLDAYIASSLINFYAKFGHAQNARKVFDVMPHRNFVPWTSIIGCYSRAGNVGIAFEMFSEIRREEVQPSSVTLVSLISGVSELAYLQCLHGCAVLYGFESDITLVNSMLNAYGKCGRVEDARYLFEYMNARDIVSWNSLISSYFQAGNIGEVFRLLYTMRVEEMEPDEQTYASAVSVAATQSNLKFGKSMHGQILRTGYELDSHVETTLMMLESRTAPSSTTIASALAACAQLGSVDMGTSVHGYVLRQGMRLDIPALNSLVTMMGIVDLLSRGGRVEEAYDFYKRGFPEPAVDVLGILLDACQTKGNEELGNIIAGEILMLRPGDAGNHVQLAHSYTSINRWDGVGEA